jgi:hypothetical protein
VLLSMICFTNIQARFEETASHDNNLIRLMQEFTGLRCTSDSEAASDSVRLRTEVRMLSRIRSSED